MNRHDLLLSVWTVIAALLAAAIIWHAVAQ
jgi:hypothetical protein